MMCGVSFNSVPFWTFCLIVVAGSYLTPQRFRWLWLLTASYLFYGTFDVRILGVLVGLTVIFKYLTLFWQAIHRLSEIVVRSGPVEPFNILVPIGISFYVFKLLSYAIDVYRGTIQAETHVGYFALYVSYFPQILAGPIERPGDFLPQLHLRGRHFLLGGPPHRVGPVQEDGRRRSAGVLR